jgi:cytoskeletal protein CcmA (bactofilin family)
MWNKQTKSPSPEVTIPPEVQQAQQRRVAARAPAGPVAPSLIQTDVTFKGTLQSKGELQLDGSVEGDVRVERLTIGESGVVNGNIYAQRVLIRGEVNGIIRAFEVQLAQNSRVTGDIIHSSLAVESQAMFNGRCRHSNSPLDEAASEAEEARPVVALQPAVPVAAVAAVEPAQSFAAIVTPPAVPAEAPVPAMAEAAPSAAESSAATPRAPFNWR